MTNLTIGITGATGFIGSALAAFLVHERYRVVRYVRNISSFERGTARLYDLKQKISDDLFQDVDVLIHCAFIKFEDNSNAEQLNYQAAERLVIACRAQGVKKVIFFSSVSAHKGASSAYGRSKFNIHQLLDPHRDLILLCSLVVGDGGLFGKMLRFVRRFRVVPLLNRGKEVIQLIAIDDVLSFIKYAIHHNVSGLHVLANHQKLTYKEIFRQIAGVYSIKVYFVRVPAVVVRGGAKLGSLLGLKIPVSGENITGLQNIRIFEPSPMLTKALDLREKLVQLEEG